MFLSQYKMWLERELHGLRRFPILQLSFQLLQIGSIVAIIPQNKISYRGHESLVST